MMALPALRALPRRAASSERVRPGWRVPGLIRRAWWSLAILALLAIAAVGGEGIGPHDPAAPALDRTLQPPLLFGGGVQHPLGTDELGRDLLSRVIAGARASLLVGLLASLGAGTVGVLLGLAAGYLGGAMDRVVTWLTEVQQALPFVIVAIGVAAVRGPSATNVILILALTGWVGYARIVRLAARPLRSATFVEAAKVAGASRSRVMLRHVLPNLLPVVLVVASQQAGAMMLYEAALSFLGLGVAAGTITWGGMVADGQETLMTAPWVATVPGVAIVLSVLAFSSLADSLNRMLWRGHPRA